MGIRNWGAFLGLILVLAATPVCSTPEGDGPPPPPPSTPPGTPPPPPSITNPAAPQMFGEAGQLNSVLQQGFGNRSNLMDPNYINGLNQARQAAELGRLRYLLAKNKNKYDYSDAGRVLGAGANILQANSSSWKKDPERKTAGKAPSPGSAPALNSLPSSSTINENIPADIAQKIADQIRESGRPPTPAYIQSVFARWKEMARGSQSQAQLPEGVVDLKDVGAPSNARREISSDSPQENTSTPSASRDSNLVLKPVPVVHFESLLNRFAGEIDPEKLAQLKDALATAQGQMDEDQLNQIIDGAYDEAKGDAEVFTETVVKQLQSRFPEMAFNSFARKDSSPADPLSPSKPIAKAESLLARDSSHSSQNSLLSVSSSRDSYGPNEKPNYFLYLGLSLCLIVVFWSVGRHLQVGAVFAGGPVIAGHSPQSPPKNQDDVILEIENRSVPDGKTQETITAVQFRMSNFEIRYSKLDRRYDIRGIINKKEIDGCLMAGSIVDAQYIPGILDYSGNLILTPQGGWVKTSEPKQRFAISPRSIMRPTFRNKP